MVVLVLSLSSENFHINIFTSNINGYPATRKRGASAFMNYSLCGKPVVHTHADTANRSGTGFTAVEPIQAAWATYINKEQHMRPGNILAISKRLPGCACLLILKMHFYIFKVFPLPRYPLCLYQVAYK